jgi:hypothetical protein
MAEVVRSKKTSEACQTFKTHMESIVVAELCKYPIQSGMRGVDIKDKNDFLLLQHIVANKTATAADVAHISAKVIPYDPSALFIDNYQKFYHALQKYRAVSELLDAVEIPDRFRKTFLQYSATISKAPLDKATADFLTQVAPSLAASLNLKKKSPDRFFMDDEEEVKTVPKSVATTRKVNSR